MSQQVGASNNPGGLFHAALDHRKGQSPGASCGFARARFPMIKWGTTTFWTPPGATEAHELSHMQGGVHLSDPQFERSGRPRQVPGDSWRRMWCQSFAHRVRTLPQIDMDRMGLQAGSWMYWERLAEGSRRTPHVLHVLLALQGIASAHAGGVVSMQRVPQLIMRSKK